MTTNTKFLNSYKSFGSLLNDKAKEFRTVSPPRGEDDVYERVQKVQQANAIKQRVKQLLSKFDQNEHGSRTGLIS